MGKPEVNNEVILMRPLVRKAKVRIIRNLIREMKILRQKRGDEKKLTKFKRRADRFLEEVKAARKIKDDEVTKFGIVNTRSLYSILDDTNSDAHTRVIAKFADFPDLKKRITEFKAKFPDYEQFIGPGKKKLAKLQKKAAQKEKKNEEQTNEFSVESNVNMEKKRTKVKVVASDNEDGSSDDEMDVDGDKIEKEDEVEDEEEEKEVKEEEIENSDDMEEGESEAPKPNLKSKSSQRLKPEPENTSESEIEVEKVPIAKKRNKKALKTLKKEKVEQSRKPEPENTASESETEVKNVPIAKKRNKKAPKTLKKEKVEQNRKLNPKEIKPVTKEATVKRFTELLQEEEEVKEASHKIKSESKTENFELKKEVDNFFMTTDGGKEYMSIVVPKKQTENQNSINDDPDYGNSHQGRNFSRNKNERFFTNMNKFEGHSDKFRRNKKDEYDSEPKFGSRTEKRNRKEAKSAEKVGNKFGKKTETSDEHLHPSWAAKKKQQDALKMGFQGKKIVFGDD